MGAFVESYHNEPMVVSIFNFKAYRAASARPRASMSASAIVIELGRRYTRAGFANEGAPRVVARSPADLFCSVARDVSGLQRAVRLFLTTLFVRSAQAGATATCIGRSA